MSPGAERLFDAAMQLSPDERIALIGRLLETTPDQAISLPPDDAGLLEELDRRYADSGGEVSWAELRAES
jgi:hypothetical protein